MENQHAAQAQSRKDLHNKSRNQNQDGDPEAPQLDELIPEKLARPEDPLERAIEFLTPLQLLAKERIETHLLAFEIYYRKQKPLLMLQSIKRARAIDANNATLHLCIVKFAKVMQTVSADKALNEYVKAVLESETVKIFGGKTAAELNQVTLSAHGKSIDHVVNVAAGMVVLDAKNKEKATKLITSLALDNATLPVQFSYLLHFLYFFPTFSHFT